MREPKLNHMTIEEVEQGLTPNRMTRKEIEGFLDVLDNQIAIRKRRIEILNRSIENIQRRIERIKAGEDIDKVMTE